MKAGIGPRIQRAASSIAVALLALAGLLFGGSAVDGITSLWFAPSVEHEHAPGEDEPFEDLRIPAESGAELHAWWFPARGETAAKGVVVHAHGNAGNLSHQWTLSAGLVPRGFHVLCFDYRGFGRSDGPPPSRRRALADLHSALDFAKQRASSEGLPLHLFGQSIGGALALEAAASRSDLAALAVDSPFSSWPGIADHHAGRGVVEGPLVRAVLFHLFQRTGKEPVEAASLVKAPLLILGGTEDRICPVSMAREIHEATDGHSRLLVIQGAGHVGLRDDAQQARMLDGVARHFMAAPDPGTDRASR